MDIRPVAVSLVIGALALAGCGDGEPGEEAKAQNASISEDKSSLRETPTTTVVAPAVVEASADAPSVKLAFTRGTAVYDVVRTIPGAIPPDQALGLLLAGPSPEEAAHGASSAIPAGVSLKSLKLDRDHAVVDLSGAFLSSVNPASQVLRMAQVACTLERADAALVKRTTILVEGKALPSLSGIRELPDECRELRDLAQAAGAPELAEDRNMTAARGRLDNFMGARMRGRRAEAYVARDTDAGFDLGDGKGGVPLYPEGYSIYNIVAAKKLGERAYEFTVELAPGPGDPAAPLVVETLGVGMGKTADGMDAGLMIRSVSRA